MRFKVPPSAHAEQNSLPVTFFDLRVVFPDAKSVSPEEKFVLV